MIWKLFGNIPVSNGGVSFNVQAIRYTDSLFDAFAELARSPKAAPACDHIRPGYRRRSVERHMIYYRILDDGIVIVRILHERMDAPRYV